MVTGMDADVVAQKALDRLGGGQTIRRAVRDWAGRGGTWQLRTILMAMVLYLGVFALMRLSLSTSLNWDSTEQMVFAQRLTWGYEAQQPPLCTWLLIGVQQILGPTLASGIALTYGLWLLTMALFYRCARRILGDVRHAALATLALLSLYQIGWMMHETFTHTIVLMACCAATLWAFCRIADGGRVADYLVLGIALGLGALSKYSFAAFACCLAGAAALQPALRRRLLRWEMALSLSVALAIALPFLLWLWTALQHQDPMVTVRSSLASASDAGWIRRVLGGLASIPLKAAAFLSPLVIMAVASVPSICKPRLPPDPPPATPQDFDLVRLIRDMLSVSILLLVLGVLVGSVANYKEYWLHPLLLFAPVYLLARIRRARPARWQMGLFVAALVVFPLGVLVTRTAHLILGPPLCGLPCRDLTPFNRLADRLAAAGFTRGTIVGTEHYTLGNLRAYFPASRVAWAGHPFVDPPRRAEGGQCLIVWNADEGGADPPGAALRYAGSLGDRGPPGATVGQLAIPWRLPLRGKEDPITTWAYLLIPGGSGHCH